MGVLHSEIYAGNLRAHIANPEASFALTCWELARRGDRIPHEASFIRQRIDWLRADMMILRGADTGSLRYDAYGANIAAHSGFDMTGKSLSEFKGALFDFYRDCYARVLATHEPLATVHRLGNYNERPTWERVILPVEEAAGGTALYVLNRVRKLQHDVALISSRARGNGVLALQFRRDEAGVITDAFIAGANAAALAMTGRRLDELLDKSIRDCFPGVVHHAIWPRYLEVAETREEQTFRVDYRMDG
ncbi:MAG: hypothetical protein ACRCTI_14460, partial [Beijerinckiaceae bacterium]